MWEPWRLTLLWASAACYRDSFMNTLNVKLLYYNWCFFFLLVYIVVLLGIMTSLLFLTVVKIDLELLLRWLVPIWSLGMRCFVLLSTLSFVLVDWPCSSTCRVLGRWFCATCKSNTFSNEPILSTISTLKMETACSSETYVNICWATLCNGVVWCGSNTRGSSSAGARTLLRHPRLWPTFSDFPQFL
jgi:hypothetical protein